MFKTRDRLTKAEYNKIKAQLRDDPNMKFALMTDKYGPFKKNQSYVQVDEGYDWVLLRNKGKLIYVGKWLIHDDPFSVLLQEPIAEETEEEEDWEVDLFQY
jgi:hypothetical protein